MKKNTRKNAWVVIGVVVAIVLLLWWLYAAILINEDENEYAQNYVEQTY